MAHDVPHSNGTQPSELRRQPVLFQEKARLDRLTISIPIMLAPSHDRECRCGQLMPNHANLSEILLHKGREDILSWRVAM
jgi:hypothetical protein